MFKIRYALLACALLVLTACPTPKPPPPPVDTVTPPSTPPVDTTAAARISLGGDSLNVIISVVRKDGTPWVNRLVTIGLAPKGSGIGSAMTGIDGSATIVLPGPGKYIACTVISAVGTFCTPETQFPIL